MDALEARRIAANIAKLPELQTAAITLSGTERDTLCTAVVTRPTLNVAEVPQPGSSGAFNSAAEGATKSD